MTNVLGAFGIVDLSPLEVSTALQALHVSHSYVGVWSQRAQTVEVPGNISEQPAWPIIVDRVAAVKRIQTRRDRLIYLVVDSRAALSVSNASQAIWPENRPQGHTFQQVLRWVLTAVNKAEPGFAWSRNEPTISDYVNAATRPSFLNHVQTAIYKITPYPLRKESQALCIAYLAGAATQTVLYRKLKSSYKLEQLAAIMMSDKAKELREAVAMLRTMTVDQVAKQTAFESFELNYIVNSYAKNKV